MSTPAIEHSQKVNLPVWKPLLYGALVPLLAKLLYIWILPDAAAWGASAFVATLLFYETPPRIGSSWLKSLLWGLMVALLVIAVSLII